MHNLVTMSITLFDFVVTNEVFHNKKTGKPRTRKQQTIIDHEDGTSSIVIESKRHGTKLVRVDNCDLPTLRRYCWTLIVGGGQKNHLYVITSNMVSGRQKNLFIHRMLMGMSDTVADPRKVDHKNGDTLDNRRVNLRITDSRGNATNRMSQRGSSSKYLGVYARPSKVRPWGACIKVGTEKRYLGAFKEEEDAALTYDAAAREAFGEFACVNFPVAGERCAVRMAA